MDQFLLFGDSLTQHSFSQDFGYGAGAALSYAYVRSLEVVNRGLSGYNTRQALQILPRVVPSPRQAQKLRFMTVWFGANDARLPNTPGDPQQHVPLDEYAANLRALLTHPVVKAHEGVRLIVVTPPPIDERMCRESDRAKAAATAGGLGEEPRRLASVSAQYAKAANDVGSELGVAVLDIWSAMMLRAEGTTDVDSRPMTGALDAPRNATLQSFLRDGLHLSPAGYRVVFEELRVLIASVWPDQTPERLEWVFPAWDDERAWEWQRGTDANS